MVHNILLQRSLAAVVLETPALKLTVEGISGN